MAVAVPVTIPLVAAIAAVSVVTLIVITTVAHVMRHGNHHGLRRDISGSVRTLNRDRVNPAAAVPRSNRGLAHSIFNLTGRGRTTRLFGRSSVSAAAKVKILCNIGRGLE